MLKMHYLRPNARTSSLIKEISAGYLPFSEVDAPDGGGWAEAAASPLASPPPTLLRQLSSILYFFMSRNTLWRMVK